MTIIPVGKNFRDMLVQPIVGKNRKKLCIDKAAFVEIAGNDSAFPGRAPATGIGHLTFFKENFVTL